VIRSAARYHRAVGGRGPTYAAVALAIAASASAWSGACNGELVAPMPERAPDPPHPIAPAMGPSGATVLRPRFAWRAAPGALRYDLELAACGGAIATCAWSLPLARASTAELAWRPTADLSRGRVGWRLRACADTCSPWTRPRWVDVGRAVGDLDGDGRSDAIAGAPLVDLGGHDRGAVVIARGPRLASTRLDEPTGTDGAEFGAALADADLDGDGRDDLIVGAPGHGDGAGRAYVYLHGGPTPLALADAGGRAGDAFGAAIATGDFDGDGLVDLAIAEPGADATATGTDAIDSDVGRVLVWRGSPTGLEAPRVITAPQPEAWDRFGASLATGDLDGDGYADLIVGAPGLDRIGARRGVDRGAVYVYRGSDDGLLAVATGLAAPVPLDHDRFGYAVAAGDIDGDGAAELFVGAPSASGGGGEDGGLVYEFRGTNGGSPARILTMDGTRYQRFGSAIAAAGDVDGDGFGDLIVGTSAPGRGLALVYRGGREGLAVQPLPILRDARAIDANAADAPDDFGDSVAGAGDIDGDGLADVLVGAASARRDGQRQGSILVFRGAPASGFTFSEPLRVDGPPEQSQFGRALAGR